MEGKTFSSSQSLQLNRKAREARKGTARLQSADQERLEEVIRKISARKLL
jgi:hypothetical protein